ncbi:hypothetical protein [Pseudomonas sp. SMN5]|uniref:hypothetical protein n=1 Tax=Pseudomonas sp. SMN5 TaxID=3390198 RepID=UPI003F85EE98
MTDQTERLEIATVKAEVGSNILSRFANDAIAAPPIPTESGDIQNLKQIIAGIETKASVSTSIYPDVATGLSATDEGGMFLVASSENDEIYAVWRKVGGVAVDTGKRSMSSQAVEDAVVEAEASAAQAAAAAAEAMAAAADAGPLRADLLAPDGATRVGWIRDQLAPSIESVAQMLNAQSVSLWEFADLVVTKPTPTNAATWDWTPAMQAFVDYCAANKLAGSIPAGTFKFNQVNLPDGNLCIHGAGPFSTFLSPYSAGTTLLYKNQVTPSGVDNQTNQLRGITDLAFADEAGLGGCRAIFCQNVVGVVLQRVQFRKLDKALEFNRCQNIVLDSWFYYKGGRFIFDASPYRKIAPSTYDYTKTVQVTNGQDLLGYSDLGGQPWLHFRDTVNAFVSNVQTPALMGKADGIKIEGGCEGIWLNNVILVWPVIGVNMRAGLIDIGNGIPDTVIDPEWNNFVAVAVDQPSGDAFFMEGDYWNMESCLAVNGDLRGTTGSGIKITSRSKHFNVSKTTVRDMPANGIEVDLGASEGVFSYMDVFDNASVSGAQVNAALTRPDSVKFRDMRVVGSVSVSGGRLVGGNTSPVISRDTGSASTPASVTPTDLMSYTIPAGTLKAGQKVKILAYGTFAANANNKTIRVFFGALNAGGWVSTTNGGAWRIDTEIELISAGSQEYIRRSDVQGASNSIATGIGAVDESAAVLVRVQGENGVASAGDIVCQHLSIELSPF